MGQKSNSLENRMKDYENVTKNYLTRHIPAIIRLDGKAFHTFTKGFSKPYDELIMRAMQHTMKKLCENIQGCVLGYTQSDEITLVLTDYATITTDAWFGYSVRKMVSISASMATLYFNTFLIEELNTAIQECIFWDAGNNSEEEENVRQRLNKLVKLKSNRQMMALFDSRAFSLPKDEVINCLIWRQQDATRNSIEAAGQVYFSHNELHKKNQSEIQNMLFENHGINWNNYPTAFKRGSCAYRVETTTPVINKKTDIQVEVTRNPWIIDTEIPIFTQDRNFIERWL